MNPYSRFLFLSFSFSLLSFVIARPFSPAVGFVLLFVHVGIAVVNPVFSLPSPFSFPLDSVSEMCHYRRAWTKHVGLLNFSLSLSLSLVLRDDSTSFPLSFARDLLCRVYRPLALLLFEQV